jgi:hypothetical protein
MIRRTPIRRVSKKRKQALTEYYRRRERFLKEHPYCQVWLMENEIDEAQLKLGIISNTDPRYKGLTPYNIPKSTEIHHTKKPKKKYLNDETTWLAVSREMHDKIEQNKNWAREKGYLQNI